MMIVRFVHEALRYLDIGIAMSQTSPTFLDPLFCRVVVRLITG